MEFWSDMEYKAFGLQLDSVSLKFYWLSQSYIKKFYFFMLKSDKFSCICLLAKYSTCYEDEPEKVFYLTVEIWMYCLASTLFFMWSPPQRITTTSVPKSTEETTYCRARMFSRKQFFEGSFPFWQNSQMIPILSLINPFHNHETYFRQI
jgi:hypothetical protein